VTGLNTTALSTSQIQLTWTNSGDATFAGVVIRRATRTADNDAFPASPTSGDQVADTAGSSFTDSNLTSEVTYLYSVFAYDTARHYSAGINASGTPRGLIDPVTNFMATAVGPTTIQLTWNNPDDFDNPLAKVSIRRSTTGYPATVSDGDLVVETLATQFTDTGLSPGTEYFYSAFAIDDVGTTSSVATTWAMTPVPPAELPMTLNLTVSRDASPRRHHDSEIELPMPATVYIPSANAIQLLAGNPSHYLLLPGREVERGGGWRGVR
jgi:chitodextrinase